MVYGVLTCNQFLFFKCLIPYFKQGPGGGGWGAGEAARRDTPKLMCLYGLRHFIQM